MYVNRGAGGEVRRVRQSKGKGRRGGQDDVAALLAAVGLSGSDIYIYVHTHTCIRVCVYAYVYIHAHTHTHVRVELFRRSEMWCKKYSQRLYAVCYILYTQRL
jgi:hypothetical protein